jgi:hypothetical protein
MTALPPDPEPADIPGLAPGGGVEPGDTPPDSWHTQANAHADPPPKRALSRTAAVSFVGLGLLLALFVLAGVLYGLDLAGAFN